MTSDAPAITPTRYAGIDGLRAVAVVLVVVSHLFSPSVLPGGFIGVDVFFVISGFLITSLLLREHSASGRIRLTTFWKRRARRLLPALALVVTVCASAAWAIGGDVLVRLGEQVLGAFTFSYNWLSIAGGDGYFGASAPELFRNFWSLAVEEQFYVVWPLVLPLFLLLPRVWSRAAAAILLALASAAWMGSVVLRGEITRGYFGTDTHGFGLLLGVALAFALSGPLARAASAARPVVVLTGGWRIISPHPDPARRRLRITTTVVGAGALGGLVLLAMLPPTMTPATFPGVVLAAAALSAVALTAGVWPGSAFGPALDSSVMRWIGDRSYGIYLWHWPLLVLVVASTQQTAPDAGFPAWVGVLVLATTLAAAELSYRHLELPVRRLGFRGALLALSTQFRTTPVRRFGAVATAVAAVFLLAGTSAGIASAPTAATAQTAVAAGVEALDAEEQPSPVPTIPPEPSPAPTAAPITGDQVTAVGDSVMLASAPALLERLPGIDVDAAVSRQGWAGADILASLAAGGTLRPYVVIALGTNGPVDASALRRMADIAGPERLVVLVTASAPRQWIDGVNAELTAIADTRTNVVLADWASAIAPRADLLAGDRIHPGAEGGRMFADVIATTIQRAEDERVRARAELERLRIERLQNRDVPRAE
ncbi:acyltransferase family protein [Planococcus sp. APC 4015]|nr:acyltransferase family protein [Planococcus sp. APC 4015]